MSGFFSPVFCVVWQWGVSGLASMFLLPSGSLKAYDYSLRVPKTRKRVSFILFAWASSWVSFQSFSTLVHTHRCFCRENHLSVWGTKFNRDSVTVVRNQVCGLKHSPQFSRVELHSLKHWKREADASG